MKLLLVDDDGTVLDSIDDLEQYDLSKPLAMADLLTDIKTALRRAKKLKEIENAQPGKW